MNLESVTVGHHTIRYLTGGNPAASRVLVLLHAFPVGVCLWEPQLDAWPDWRVLAPALPGFDGSTPLDEPSTDAYARQVIGFLSALNVPRAVCAGLSMGGYILFALLRARPELVKGLILADTRSGADTEDGRAGRQRMRDTLAKDGVEAVGREVIPKLLGDTTRRDRPAVAARVQALIAAQLPAGVDAAIRVLMTRPDAAPQLAAIEVPTLIVVGEEDVLTPPAEAERLHAAIQGSTLARLPGAGHLSSLETPGAFNAVVAKFLREAA